MDVAALERVLDRRVGVQRGKLVPARVFVDGEVVGERAVRRLAQEREAAQLAIPGHVLRQVLADPEREVPPHQPDASEVRPLVLAQPVDQGRADPAAALEHVAERSAATGLVHAQHRPQRRPRGLRDVHEHQEASPRAGAVSASRVSLARRLIVLTGFMVPGLAHCDGAARPLPAPRKPASPP